MKKKNEPKPLTPADMWQPGLNRIYNGIKSFIIGSKLRPSTWKPSEYWEIFSKGGRSSGKSTATAFWVWLALENDPEKNAVIIRKTAAHLRKTVFEQMDKCRKQLGYLHWKKNATQMIFENKETGQKIYFVGLDNEESIRSITVSTGYISIVWFEEAKQFANYEEMVQAKTSILRGGAELGQTAPSDAEYMTFITYNPPKSGNHWINREAAKSPKGRLTHASTYLTMPPAWLGKNIIEEAERMKKENFKQYCYVFLGESVGVEQQFYTNVTFRKITDEEIARMKWFDYGIDWGDIDPNVWLKMHFSDGKLYYLDEIVQKGKQSHKLDKFAKLVKDKMRGQMGEPIYADCQSKTNAERLNDEGLNVHDGTPKHGANGRMAGAEFLTGIEIICDPERTPEVADHLQTFEHAEEANGRGFRDEPQRFDDHIFDCSRYGLNKYIAKGDLNKAITDEQMDALSAMFDDDGDDDDDVNAFADDEVFDINEMV